MKKIPTVSSLLCALGLAFPLLVFAASAQLNVPTVTQEHSEWCWDADSNAVLTYRKVSTTQCGIANWSSNINYACGQNDFDWDDGGPGNSPNYMTGDTGISGILWSLGNRNSDDYQEPIAYNTIASAIDNGNPVVILWQWTGGGGHFVVIDGYDDNGQNIAFMNPWPGEGAESGSYDWMQNGSSDMGTHSWVESLITY